jgi:hypothetical protein
VRAKRLNKIEFTKSIASSACPARAAKAEKLAYAKQERLCNKIWLPKISPAHHRGHLMQCAAVMHLKMTGRLAALPECRGKAKRVAALERVEFCES